VVDFEIAVVVAARALAFVAEFGENFAPQSRWYCRFVSFADNAGLAVALGFFDFGFNERQLALAGLNRCFCAIWALVDVDLGGW